MPPLLSRYVLSELVRVLLLTTVVLVTVIAFGAAIKPLARESFLTVQQTLKYVLLATVPMLQFALPFAAGYASTMVLHRMVGDNEIVAMRAGGISYPRLLMPIAGFGLVLSIIMVLLTQSIIPHFWELMRRTISTDVTTALVTSIDRGRPFQTQNIQIHADRVLRETPALTGEGPDERLRLIGVAAAELEPGGAIRTEITAQQAIVDLYRRDDRTIINLHMIDAVAFNHNTNELISWERYQPRRPISIPNVFSNDTRFMGRAELLEVRDDPDRLDAVRDRRDALTEALRALVLMDGIDQPLRMTGAAVLRDASMPGRTYRIEAESIEAGRLQAGADGVIVLTQLQDGEPRRVIEARDMQLTVADDLTGVGGEPRFDLIVNDCLIREVDSGIVNRRGRLALPGLLADVPMGDQPAGESSRELLARLATMPEHVQQALASQIRALEQRLLRVQREVPARLWRRHALSTTALLLLMLGAVLALKMRDAQPLMVYTCAFSLAVLDLVLISTGDHMMRDGYRSGFYIMWAGNAVLLTGMIVTYLRLIRN